MKVRDYMSAAVITANMNDGLRQTWGRMYERHIRHMPVLDEHEKLVGVISDRDLRRPGSVDVGGVGTFTMDNSMKVREAMSGNPVTVSADDPLQEAAQLFLDKNYGALPVVNDEGRVAGMLSTQDMIRALSELLKKG